MFLEQNLVLLICRFDVHLAVEFNELRVADHTIQVLVNHLEQLQEVMEVLFVLSQLELENGVQEILVVEFQSLRLRILDGRDPTPLSVVLELTLSTVPPRNCFLGSFPLFSPKISSKLSSRGLV